MFGFGQKVTDQQREAEKQALEREMHQLKVELAKMREVSPQDAERMHQYLKDRCGQSKTLPYDFKRKLLERARLHECNANMRAANKVLHEALRLAAEEQMQERTRKLGEGRAFYSKACTLGADEDFRKAGQRLMENILMTGGVQHKGPTRAKPADFAPKAPNRAKMESAGPKAPNRAKI